MPGWADLSSARARKAFRLALNEIGRMIVADIRAHISEPVQHTPLGAIRSEPGEEPFREFSDLYKSIKYKVESGATTLEDLVVFTDRIQAFYLEFGTNRMEPRPFWMKARGRATGLQSLLKTLFAQYLMSMTPFNAGTTIDDPRFS